jgi:endoglycosylceramidase
MRRPLLSVLLPILLLPACGPAAVPGLPPPLGQEDPEFRLPGLHAELDPVGGGRIVDAHGREMLLRGVNLNAFVEYWAYDPELFTTYPFTEADAARIAEMGWTVVRLLLSWSRVEPEPGAYDEAYLDQIEEAVRILEQRGVYSIIDLHQDAWGPSLAARAGEVCLPSEEPAFGWDGASAWATLDGGAARCALGGVRELSPAVGAAFDAFWGDDPGPGGVGIRTRYVQMLAHLAARFAPLGAVAGYDLMNEPNAFVFVGPQLDLTAFYAEAVTAIRTAEASVGAPRRLVFFEPSILWNDFLIGAPLPFGDDQMVYSPHIYQGGINSTPLTEAIFQQARAEAATFGGVPVLSGEWGSDPRRAEDPSDDYFERHQALQDRFRFGATLWTWREACGDPHKAGDVRDGRVPFVWGLFDVDCAVNQVNGTREPLRDALLRAFVRAAPGPLGEATWDPAARHFEARGDAAPPEASFIVFWPSRDRVPPRIEAHGLQALLAVPAGEDHHFVVGRAVGGAWELVLDD